MEQELYVWDTELTVGAGRCYLHASRTKEKPRLTDGERHLVRIVQPTKKVVKNGRV